MRRTDWSGGFRGEARQRIGVEAGESKSSLLQSATAELLGHVFITDIGFFAGEKWC